MGQHITLIIPRERRNEEDEILARLRRGERIDHFETVRVGKDGTLIDVSLTISPVKDASGNVVGASKVARDITQRKQAERALRESEERFRAIVETTPECVILVAPDGTLLHMNSPGPAMFGADTPEMVVRRNIYDLIAPEDRDRFCRFNEEVCRGKAGFLEFDIVTLQGLRRQMETHAAPMTLADGTTVQLAITLDVTERKRTQETLRKVEKLAAAGQLAAALAHEINNPLSAVTNAVYLLRKHSSLDVWGRELVEMAGTELARVSRIVKQSRAYHRIGSTPKIVDLGEIVAESVQIFVSKMQREGIALSQKIEPGNLILGFPDELRQIVDNLLLNAIEAMRKGGHLAVSVHDSVDWKND